MDLSAYIDIPILIAVYILIEIGKKIVFKTDEARSFIPIAAPVIGSVLSIIVFLVWPDMSTNTNVVNAFACGAVSGAAATGSNQIYKQISKFFNTSEE